MVSENGLAECSPSPHLTTPNTELINFFGGVETVVGVKSGTPLCVAPGFSPPWGSPATHFPFPWNLGEQRSLLVMLKAWYS